MKNIFPILSVALLSALAACTPKNTDPEFIPDTTFNKTGEVTVLASMENCVTKASMTYSGEARWQAGDQIAVSCTDGSLVVLSLDGTGGTRKAFFKGEIPSGKELGSYAFYPVSAIKSLAGTTASAELSDELGSGNCALMAARIGDSYEIEFVQLLSYASIQIGNIPMEADRLVISSDKALSGAYSFDVAAAMESGLPARDGDAPLVALLGDKQTSATFLLALPVSEYTSLHVSSLNGEGKTLTESEILTSAVMLSRRAQRTLEITLPEYEEEIPEIPGTVYVCGLYWATGNLLHSVGVTDEGFQTDWSIAPAQWYYVNCENATGSAVTFRPSDHSNYDHFNFGGIEDPFTNAEASSINAAVGTDISGKMFLDRGCLSPTEDFEAAKFGDLAWWASKGKWRMPTQEEIAGLIANASAQPGTYVTPDGKTIAGMLFTNPVGGQVISTSAVELTDEDLAKGVFFPLNGRRYNSQPLPVPQQGSQGTYWSSTVTTIAGGTDGLCYPAMIYLTAVKVSFPHSNAAFDSKAGYAIKPVYVE